jgi:hypothetical protein
MRPLGPDIWAQITMTHSGNSADCLLFDVLLLLWFITFFINYENVRHLNIWKTCGTCRKCSLLPNIIFLCRQVKCIPYTLSGKIHLIMKYVNNLWFTVIVFNITMYYLLNDLLLFLQIYRPSYPDNIQM